MKQTYKLDYACGVIACIHSIFNNMKELSIKEDSILDKFYKMSKNMTPLERALNLEDNHDF